MKRMLAAMAALTMLCATGCRSVKSHITFAQVDPLQKVLRETTFFPQFDRTLDYAAGESAVFQFVVRSDVELTDLQVSVEGMENVRLGFLGYVSDGYKDNDQGFDAIVSTQNYYPDPIIETSRLDKPVPRENSQPVWVTVDIPRDTPAGTYEGTFVIKGRYEGRRFTFRKDISYTVYPVVLEEPDLWVTNWFSVDRAEYVFGSEKVEPGSDKYFEFIKMLAEKMKENHHNVMMFNLSLIDVTLDGEKYSFDYSLFDKVASIFREAGILKMLEVGHLGGRLGGWDDDFGVRVPLMEGGSLVRRTLPLSDARTRNYCEQFIPSLVNHIKEMGLYDIYVQHIADEPVDANCKSYVAIARYIKQLAPGTRLIEAIHSGNLDDVLDVWVPQLDYFSSNYDFYKSKMEEGDQVWFYTCMYPHGDYANRFLEQPLLKTRLLHWINYRYGATGYLHWGYNYWHDDVWSDISTVTSAGSVLPAGDAYIVYPGDGQIYRSIRFEAFRDGIADYTLLKMLAEKNKDAADRLCRSTVFSFRKYDMTSHHFYDTRTEILKLLSGTATE